MTTTIAPHAAFIPVTVLIEHDGVITRHDFVGQPIAPGLAITPAIGPEGFSGGWAVTHTPTGNRVAAARGCLSCVKAAANHLTNSGVDWTRTDPDEIKADDIAKRAADAYASDVQECGGAICDFWAVA